MKQNLITSSESKRLTALESTIAKGKQSFVEVGCALAEIRDSKLYRSEFKTFEEYCTAKWGWGRQRAHELITASKVSMSLPEECNKIITNDAQARELSSVPVEDRPATVALAAATGSVTAASIRKVKQNKAAPQIESDPESDARPRIQTATEILQSHPADVKELIRSKVACIQTDCALVLRGVDRDQIADLGPLANELIELAKSIRALANTHLE